MVSLALTQQSEPCTKNAEFLCDYKQRNNALIKIQRFWLDIWVKNKTVVTVVELGALTLHVLTTHLYDTLNIIVTAEVIIGYLSGKCKHGVFKSWQESLKYVFVLFAVIFNNAALEPACDLRHMLILIWV